MRATKFAIAWAAVTLLTATAAAEPVNRLWVFGDSTVDTGWYKIPPYSGLHSFDIYLDNPALGVGKPTTNPGPISVQVLGHLLDVSALPENQGGTNYATSGARNRERNDVASGLFPNAVPTELQIDHYLHVHIPNSRALYVISSGANDVSYALQNPTGQLTAPLAYVQNAANALGAKIAALQEHGAKYIIVANLPSSFGTQSEMQYRAVYNATLQNKLDSLNVKYAWGDTNATRLKVVANPSDFGIVYTTNAAGQRACSDPMTGPDPSLAITSGWALLCSPKSPVSMTNPVWARLALFADNEHFATGGQTILGSYYYCLARQVWPQLFTLNPARHPPIACAKFFPTPSM